MLYPLLLVAETVTVIFHCILYRRNGSWLLTASNTLLQSHTFPPQRLYAATAPFPSTPHHPVSPLDQHNSCSATQLPSTSFIGQYANIPKHTHSYYAPKGGQKSHHHRAARDFSRKCNLFYFVCQKPFAINTIYMYNAFVRFGYALYAFAWPWWFFQRVKAISSLRLSVPSSFVVVSVWSFAFHPTTLKNGHPVSQPTPSGSHQSISPAATMHVCV